MRHFLTYDLEWIPKELRVRLVGVFDGQKYRSYRTVGEFLENEMTSKNRGKWFYAHAGGLADFQFVLEEILRLKTRYKVRASFSGSSAIIVHVTRGKNAWHFIDSYWLLRAPLRDIGKWIGISKGNADEDIKFYSEASYAELREYNEVDCEILYRAIQQFEDVLLDLGGMLKMTQASCAMELFRRRFLKIPIETSSTVNDLARKAYVASRVEVFQTECHDALYYDVNSSFPYSMTKPCPGPLKRVSPRIPDEGIYLADCEIETGDTYMPVMPRRLGGRIFFPIGRWRGWFSSIDLDLLREQGGKIHRVYQCLEFEPFNDLADYANTLYDLRVKSDGFMKIGCKYLLNSLYGKFAESDQKSSMLINPDRPPDDDAEMVFPGVFLIERTVPIPHMHVPISVHITAHARRTLFDYMASTYRVHYCDTDGFSTTDVKEESDGLGGIKLEKLIRRGVFVQPKLYKIEGEDASKMAKGPWPVQELGDAGAKGKGFSRMTVAKFDKLVKGDDLEYVRMARIKELIRKGVYKPREDTITKHLSGDSLPKRFFYPDGHSRPWSVEELDGVFPPDKQKK